MRFFAPSSWILVVTLIALACFANAQRCALTAADIEGPYYKPGAPNRTETLCPHSPAVDRLILRGRVFGDDCKTPLAFTKLDVWQADAQGVYSEGKNWGSDDFTCRAVLITDADGFYTFTTVFPGRYDDDGFRPAHIHWRITPQDRSYNSITTQLYFKSDAYLYPNDSCKHCNSKDPSLVASVSHIGSVNDIKTYEGTWNIILGRKKHRTGMLTSVKSTYTSIKEHIMPKKVDIKQLQFELKQAREQLAKYAK